MDPFFSYASVVSSIFSGASSLVGLASWLLMSYAVYRMAKNAGIPSPGVAFVPVVGAYYRLGMLAERSLYARTGKKKAIARRNLWYPIVICILSVILVVAGGLSLIRYIAVYESYAYAPGTADAALIIFLLLAVLVIAVLAVIQCVWRYITLYNIYQDYTPDNPVLFLILSIFLPIVPLIVLLICKENVPVSVAGRVYPAQPKYQNPVSGAYGTYAGNPNYSGCAGTDPSASAVDGDQTPAYGSGEGWQSSAPAPDAPARTHDRPQDEGPHYDSPER